LLAGSHTVTLTGLAPNCAISGPEALTVVVTEGETTDVAFEVECQYDLSGSVLPELVCSGLAPAAADGLPGDLVSLGALPVGLEGPVFARVMWPDGEEVALAFVDPDESSWSVPLHPSGSMEGGAVQVRISDEEAACPPFPFSIDALPPAPGEYAAIVDLMQDLIEAQATLMGLTVTDLVEAELADLPLYVAPLAISQGLVDHPDNPNSMRAALAGTAPEMEGLDIDFFDALLALTGIRDDMQAALEKTREGIASLEGQAAASAPTGAPILNALDCFVFGPIVRFDAESLDRCMDLGRDKIPGPAGTQARQLLANYFMAAAVVPVLKPLMTAASGLLLAMGTYDDILASNLPTEFVSIEVFPDRAVWEEDRDGPGTWTPALVTATSTGWRFDRVFFEMLVRAVKATPTFRTYMEKAGQAANSFFTSIPSAINEELDAWLANFFGQALHFGAQQFFESVGGVSPLEIGPRTFGPIDISSETYSTSRIVIGDAFVRTSHEEYEPRQPGISQIEVITAQDRFGGANIATDPFPTLEVSRIDLDFELGPFESGDRGCCRSKRRDRLQPHRGKLRTPRHG
jgi:hypothetical protein